MKCYVDDGEMKDAAVKCAALCFKFCEKCVPEKLEDIIAIQVGEELMRRVGHLNFFRFKRV